MASHQQGVLIALTRNLEWMLPWWWHGFHKSNRYPLTIIDWGLSPQAKSWCQKRASLLPGKLLPQGAMLKPSVDPALAKKWEELYGPSFWQSRSPWFSKPFALSQTPYETTLWLDVDCQVRGSLEELFAIDLGESKLALAKDRGQWRSLEKQLIEPQETLYNSGVILFHRDSEAIAQWVLQAPDRHPYFIGDQHLLSRILFERKQPPIELAPIYNAPFNPHEKSVPADALIGHWVGPVGKLFIEEQIRQIERHENICLSNFSS